FAELGAHRGAHGGDDPLRIDLGSVPQEGEDAANRVVDRRSRPCVAVGQLLEDVELTDLRWRVSLPAAPASVVLVVILAETRLEFLVPALGPRETVLERRHQPSKKGRKPLFSQAPPSATMQAPLT